jgi:hypothetical protein
MGLKNIVHSVLRMVAPAISNVMAIELFEVKNKTIIR